MNQSGSFAVAPWYVRQSANVWGLNPDENIDECCRHFAERGSRFVFSICYSDQGSAIAELISASEGCTYDVYY